MTLSDLLTTFKLEAIYGIDYETYYSKEYSLKKLATTEYIFDERFAAHCIAVQRHTDEISRVFAPQDFRPTERRYGILAHHAHFDGLIATHHAGLKPAFYFDTLSMARLIMPITVPLNLDSLSRALGGKGKVGSQSLIDTMGKQELTLDEYERLAAYAGNDIEETWCIFHKMLPFVPEAELRLIDITVKMYTEPKVRINAAMTERVYDDEIASKEKILVDLGLSREDFTSNERFAVHLANTGITVPTKTNKNGAIKPALAKNDLEFKILLQHPNDRVRALVAGRIALKTSIMETRSLRMNDRSKIGAQPIYLNYCGARRTLRWSGSDKMNWQNLKRGSDLRRAIRAPVGHKLVISDQSQIEARWNAYLAKDQDKLNAFIAYDQGTGPDLYKRTAALDIFRKPIEEIDGQERFVGKTAELGLGYGAGAPKFANMLRVGQFGPPVAITDEEAHRVVTSWRQGNAAIVRNWKSAESAARTAFCGQRAVEFGPVVFEGRGDLGLVTLPNGTCLRYDGFEVDEENNMSYISEARGRNVFRNKLYGGLIVENLCQALSRALLAEQIVNISKKLPKAHIATCTHDEVVIVVESGRAKVCEMKVVEIMSKTPAWCKGLPLSVKAETKSIYDKS